VVGDGGGTDEQQRGDLRVGGGLAVLETEFGKALGGGLYEFRLRWSAAEVQRKVEVVSAGTAAKAEKIMLRVFFCTSGRKIILLLSGYDKTRGSGHTAPPCRCRLMYPLSASRGIFRSLPTFMDSTSPVAMRRNMYVRPTPSKTGRLGH